MYRPLLRTSWAERDEETRAGDRSVSHFNRATRARTGSLGSTSNSRSCHRTERRNCAPAPRCFKPLQLAPAEAKRGYDASFTSGTFHVPSRIDGGFSFAQYIRIMRTNVSAGAGSQFDSFSLPGDSCWM